LTYWTKEYQNFNNNISVFKNSLDIIFEITKRIGIFLFSEKFDCGLSIPVKNLEVVKQIEKEFFGFHPSIITEKKNIYENGNNHNQHYIMIGWLSLVNHACYYDGLKFYQIKAEKKRMICFRFKMYQTLWYFWTC